MNKQRKVVITITYNEMGIIIDTKAEEITQPNLQPTCNQLATDCISRQAAIDLTWKDPSYSDPLNVLTEVRDGIKPFPSAQPEIIRCKDCRYRDEFGCCKYWVGLTMGMPTTATDDDDFCSYAKRRTE